VVAVTPDDEWPQHARDAGNSRWVPRRRPGYRRQPAVAFELPAALSAPVVAGGLVACTRDASTVSPDGEYRSVIELAVHRLDTGEVVWERALPPSPGTDSYSPAIAGDVVCVAFSDLLIAHDLRSGEQRWEQAGAPYGGLDEDDGLDADAPTVVGTTLYVRSTKKLSAVDPRTGRTRWSRRPDRYGGSAVPGTPVIGGTAVVGCDDGIVVALDAASGRHRWPAVTGPQLEFAPCAAGDLVAVASGDRVYGLDLATGERRWRHRIGEPVLGGLAATDRAVVVTAGTTARALSIQDGRPRWTRRLSGSPAAPSVAGDVVVVPSEYPHQVHGIGLDDGERCWTVRLGTRQCEPVLRPEAVVVGDRLLVTAGGRVTVLTFGDD
jgi:outer membrane protein assembly factor BamB